MIMFRYLNLDSLIRWASNLIVFGYLGPENLIPLASILAAAIGFILLFWQRGVRLVRRLLGRSRRDEPADLPSPEDDTKD
jgi:hypothetical protein